MKVTFIKSLTILAFTVILAAPAQAQQDPMYAQYMFNGLIINPAYAGSNGTLSLSSLTRAQWVSTPGAPVTQVFSAHAPVGSKVSLGANFVHDRIGSTVRNGFSGIYAYSLPFIGKGTLSFGLQASLMSFSNEPVSAFQAGDPLNAGSETILRPNFGAGVYFYNDKLFLGLASPTLLRSSFGVTGETAAEMVTQDQHFFAYAGYLIDLSENVKFKPNTMVRYVTNAPTQIDLNANFLLNNKLWLGASYRSLDSFALISEFLLSQYNLSIGYAFEFPHTRLSARQFGSHEILLNYRIKPKNTTTLTPRYF